MPVRQWILILPRDQKALLEGALRVEGIGSRSWPVITKDGTGMVSHTATALLREMSERVELRGGFAETTDGLRSRRSERSSGAGPYGSGRDAGR